METGIKIGHSEQSVKDVSNLIRYIIDAPTGECVKLAALKAMKETLNINNASFSNCYIGDETHNHYADDKTDEGNLNHV